MATARRLPGVNLSPREREILALLAEGRSQKQIAAALLISSKTVATHIQHLLSKLDVHSRAEAVAAAYQGGLGEADMYAPLPAVARSATEALAKGDENGEYQYVPNRRERSGR